MGPERRLCAVLARRQQACGVLGPLAQEDSGPGGSEQERQGDTGGTRRRAHAGLRLREAAAGAEQETRPGGPVGEGGAREGPGKCPHRRPVLGTLHSGTKDRGGTLTNTLLKGAPCPRRRRGPVSDVVAVAARRVRGGLEEGPGRTWGTSLTPEPGRQEPRGRLGSGERTPLRAQLRLLVRQAAVRPATEHFTGVRVPQRPASSPPASQGLPPPNLAHLSITVSHMEAPPVGSARNCACDVATLCHTRHAHCVTRACCDREHRGMRLCV